MIQRWLYLFAFTVLCCPSAAQQPTRAGEIEELRQRKAADLASDAPPKAERIIRTVQHDVLENVLQGWNGLRLSLGGLYPRSGFAFGPEYFRPDLAGGNVQFRTSVRTSLRKFEKGDIELTFPHLGGNRAFVELLAVYRNYPSVDYYGPGPDSAKSGRSDYRLEDSSMGFTAGFRPLDHLTLGATGSYLRVNIGPGDDERFASADQVYTAAQTPGITQQSHFLRGGPFVQYDYRDRPGDPHKGGNYVANFTYYDDERFGTYNFRRVTAEAQQYVPFLNEKRVLSLRGKTELTYHNGGAPVPFYLQPTLGGSEDLRGYRVFRFYDDNSLLLNGEYRWEVMSGFDMALFVDSGKVFRSKANLNFEDMRTDAGFGLRFSNAQAVFMRWDVGFSKEGFEVWIKFGNVF
jgi:outer membrane protein assembly factor BamA